MKRAVLIAVMSLFSAFALTGAIQPALAQDLPMLNLVGWGGSGDYGQARAPGDATNSIAVAAGELYSLALKSDGTVVAWGRNMLGPCDVPAGLTGVTEIGAGGHHCLALRDDGTVIVWGSNQFGQRVFRLGSGSRPTSPSGITTTWP